MGRAGGRAGEGVTPLNTTNGFNGLQQNQQHQQFVSGVNSLVMHAPFDASPRVQNAAYSALSGYELPSGTRPVMPTDLASLLPLSSQSSNLLNALVKSHDSVQNQAQHPGLQGSATAGTQFLSLGSVQSNGTGIEWNKSDMGQQISQMIGMSQGQVGNVVNNGHALNQAHALQMALDSMTKQNQISGQGPPMTPLGSGAPGSNPATTPHPGAQDAQGPAQSRARLPAMKNGHSAPRVDPGESSGAESAEEAPSGKGDRKEARKEYHKRIERKRRDRMRNLYDELRSLVNPSEPADKNSVLAGAVSLIQDLRDENTKLQTRVRKQEKADEDGKDPQIHVLKSAGHHEEGHIAGRRGDDSAEEAKATGNQGYDPPTKAKNCLGAEDSADAGATGGPCKKQKVSE